jgi:hypothetical protein
MIIIGVDYHPSDQYIAFVDTETGEYGERQLNHSDREAEKFYRELAARGAMVRLGMEATGNSRWFERLLAELGIEVWIGEAAEIKTKRVRKQKTDRVIFFAKNLEKAHEWLAGRGVAVEPTTTDSGGNRLFRFQDLEGNTIEVCVEP